MFREILAGNTTVASGTLALRIVVEEGVGKSKIESEFRLLLGLDLGCGRIYHEIRFAYPM